MKPTVKASCEFQPHIDRYFTPIALALAPGSVSVDSLVFQFNNTIEYAFVIKLRGPSRPRSTNDIKVRVRVEVNQRTPSQD